MAGIGFGSVDTDVSSLVASAFDQIECYMTTGVVEHEGDVTAYVDCHGHISGYVCAAHFKRITDYWIPNYRGCIEAGIPCGFCKKHFDDVNDWLKVYPL